MTKIQNETRGAAPRCSGLLGFVVLVLALSFGSLAANAAPQVLKANAGRTACRITNINAATGVVTAKVLFEEGGIAGSKTSGSGQSFRFLVKDSALLRSLKDGQEIFADFKTQQVFTSAGVRLGTILADNSGNSLGGAAGQPCLSGNACNAGLVCRNNTCVAGGAAGQPCLSGGVCSSGLVCSNSVCAPVQCSGGACSCNSAADCPADQACDPNRHACTSACSPTAPCNGGCCQQNGLCGPGTFSNACGAGGGVCAVCGGNTPSCTSAIGGGVCAASAQGTKPTGPGSGTNPQPNKILQQPNKVTEPGASGSGSNPPPNKIGGTNPAVHAGGANLGNAANPATSAGKNPSIPATAGSNLGGAAAPAASVSQITNINTPRGIVAAKVNSSGQSFRFFVKDATLLNSLKQGQQIVADFNTQEAFTSAGASGRGVRLGSILTDSYTMAGGGPAGGTTPPEKIGGAELVGPGVTGGQPKTQSAPVAPGGPVAGIKQPATNAPPSSQVTAALRTAATLQSNPVCSSDPSHLTQTVASQVIVPSGATIYCRFSVPSDVAQQAGASVTVSVSDSSVLWGQPVIGALTASAGSGNPYADFRVFTQAISETFPLTISASYGQFSASTSVTLARAAIKWFFGTPAGIPSGGYMGWGMQEILTLWLTAPADPNGLHIPVTADDGSFSGEIDVAGGTTGGYLGKVPHQPVLTDTPVTYSVHDPLDGSLQTVRIVVQPPQVSYIQGSQGYPSVSNVPLDGTQVPFWVSIFGDAPPGGMTFNVNYSAVDAKNNALPSEITGPSSVTLPAGTVNTNVGYGYTTQLSVTVFPCGVNPPCTATVTIGAQKATITVNP